LVRVWNSEQIPEEPSSSSFLLPHTSR
jgi:hypothetical protein